MGFIEKLRNELVDTHRDLVATALRSDTETLVAAWRGSQGRQLDGAIERYQKLLDERMPQLCAQIKMHFIAAASDQALGARAHSRSGARAT